MKVCVYVRALMTIYPYYYKCLKERYGNVFLMTFVVQNDLEEKDVYHNIGKDAHIVNVAEYMKKNWDSLNELELSEYESKYETPPIWNMIYQDRFLIKQPKEYCIKIACGYFRLYTELFQNKQYDFYIDETIANLSSLIAYYVAIRNNTKYRAQMLTRGFDSELHYYINDPMQLNFKFDPNYMKKDYSLECRKKAEDYYNKINNSYVQPQYMKSAGIKPRFHIGYIKTPFRYCIARFSSYWNNKYDYIAYQSYKHVGDSFRFYTHYQKCKKYFNKPDYSKKYVFFPLHFQPEATTLVCAEKYEKQLFFIDQIAKSLPIDTLLYVKEHYAFLGHRDPSFYKDLQNYPNVVLIDPFVQAKDLIMSAETVVTLTGTAGWEAFVMQKPVIVCGNVFYQNAPGIMKTNEIYMNYLSERQKWKKPTKDEIIKYLCEHIETSCKACQCVSNPGYKNENNLMELARSLVNEIENSKQQ